jgi:hypothetical protein
MIETDKTFFFCFPRFVTRAVCGNPIRSWQTVATCSQHSPKSFFTFQTVTYFFKIKVTHRPSVPRDFGIANFKSFNRVEKHYDAYTHKTQSVSDVTTYVLPLYKLTMLLNPDFFSAGKGADEGGFNIPPAAPPRSKRPLLPVADGTVGRDKPWILLWNRTKSVFF